MEANVVFFTLYTNNLVYFVANDDYGCRYIFSIFSQPSFSVIFILKHTYFDVNYACGLKDNLRVKKQPF